MKSGNRILVFDGLRFVFIFFLMLHHFSMFSALNLPHWDSVMKIFMEGFVSVNFFFILSGFVIQYSYKSLLLEAKISSAEFFFRRIVHLYPLYFIFLYGALVLYRNDWNIFGFLSSPVFATHLLMIQSWLPVRSHDMAFQFNGLSWAVSTEVFFYFAYTFLVLLPLRKLLGLVLSLFAFILLEMYFVGLGTKLSSWLFYVSPFTRLMEFVIGMALCDILRQHRPALADRGKLFGTCMEAGAVALLAFAMYLGAVLDISWIWKWQMLYIIPCALLISVFFFQAGRISDLLSSRLFVFLGNISLCLYLCHQEVFHFLMQQFGGRCTSMQDGLLLGGAGIAVSLALSCVLQYAVVLPAQAAARRLFHRRREDGGARQ